MWRLATTNSSWTRWPFRCFVSWSRRSTAEGHRFELVTPPGVVRLVPARSLPSFVELSLDVSGVRPVVMGRSSVRRGRETAQAERPLRPDTAVSGLTREDVLEFLLESLGPFVV